MLLTETGFRLFEHLERQKDVPSLLTSFHELIRSFGMHCFCIGNPSYRRVQHANRRWDGSWPRDWELHYAEQDYLSIDPLVDQMHRTRQPFRSSSVFAHADGRQRRVLEDARQFGLGEGICVPIHGPNGVMAGVSLTAESGHDLSPGDDRALQMASIYLHARLTVLRAEAPRRAAQKLTARERECLTWVAAGKTDWEISQILGIAEQTAHGYVQSALTKLGASTRAQAVALAMLSAQIKP